MRGNKACQLFVLDKCYTKQKLNKTPMMAKEGESSWPGKKTKTLPSWAPHCHFKSLKIKPAGFGADRGFCYRGIDWKKVALHKNRIPVARRAYLRQQDARAPAPAPGRLPAHQVRTPGSPRQTSPPPASPANTLSPSAQPAQLSSTKVLYFIVLLL